MRATSSFFLETKKYKRRKTYTNKLEVLFSLEFGLRLYAARRLGIHTFPELGGCKSMTFSHPSRLELRLFFSPDACGA